MGRRLLLLALLPFVLLALLLLPHPALAQENPDTGRGFQADKVYRFGQLDSVNLFNGNLTLVLPIGGSYPVNGALSYALTLTYNSNVWRFDDYQWWQPDGGIVTSRRASLEQTNAGPGWRLTLGEVQDASYAYNDGVKWVYVGQDGARHAFYDTLHVGETASGPYTYTRDGSYLRLFRSAGDECEVHFPDGSVHTFRDDGTGRYRPVTLDDAFGNRLTVSYLSSPTRWVLDDGHRTHTVYFQNRTIDSHTWTVVDRVELAAFGGATATYDFSYVPKSVEESAFDNDPNTGGLSGTRNAYVLDSITLPEGATWNMAYYDVNDNELTGADASASGNQGGVLKELTLPTLGSYDWTYQDYEFPTRAAAGQGGAGSVSLATSTGVKRKRMLDAAGDCRTHGTDSSADNQVGCAWFYAWSQDLAQWERTTTVTTPNGDDTVHYFDVQPRPDPDDWTGWEYGLPFTKATTDAAGRFLSQRIYEGSAATGTLKREVWVVYGRDKLSNVRTEPHDWENTNRRLRQRRVLFEDDGNHYRQQTMSDFDGLGHFRSVQTSSSLPGGATRTAVTRYNPDNGSYTVDLADNTVSGGYQPWSTSTAWVLGTYDETRTTEGSGATAVEQFCFEAGTGFLLRHRVLEGTSPGADDVLVVNTRGTLGNLFEQRHFGGDGVDIGQALATTDDLCSLTLPGSDLYRRRYLYDFGAVSHASWRNANGTGFLETLDRTVDPHTALPSRDTDAAGVHVDYDYDLQSRLTLEKPETGHGGRTTYNYVEATSASSLARVEVRHHSNDGSVILAESQVVFDAHGRPWRDRRREASGVWSSVDTVRDAMGRKRTVSERQSGVPDALTTYKRYDPFGRPQRVEPPDTASHRVLFWYTGERVMQREVMVCGLAGGCPGVSDETKHQITERYDRHGRLYQVVEPSGASNTNVTTTYRYDVGNRLREVTTAAEGVTQRRTFTYGHRGFLLSELHPEKGSAGNGFVTYSAHDPLGNPGRKLDGPFDVRYGYDRAGRLTAVDEKIGTATRPLKRFTYAPTNDGADLRAGKLQVAERFNHVTLNDNALTVRVKETYTYAGKGGAVSRRDTELFVNGADAESFTQGFAWTDLGDVATLDYPECTHDACTQQSGMPLPRSQGFTYTRGFLTAVPGYATLGYHPNGMLHQVHHSNGVTDTIALDPSGMARPASISTSGATDDWSSGTYRYDGSGNVTQIGSSRFAYDGVSRLIDATVSLEQDDGCSGDLELTGATVTGSETHTSCASILAGPSYTVAATGDLTLTAADRVILRSGFRVESGGRLTAGTDATIPGDGGGGTAATTTRSYTHDAYGNLTAISGDGGRTIPVDPDTNRLSGIVAHDAAGNLTSWNGRTFKYDAMGMLWGQSRPIDDLDNQDPNDEEEWLYLYTADDERVWSYHFSGSTWTLRGLDGRLLRRYRSGEGGWTVHRDYLHRGSRLLAANEPGVNIWHFTLDHLGTPRLVTGNAAFQRSFHVYYPYGEEATSWNQDDEPMKFTGHERDFTDGSSPADDLDYMHARFYGPLLGRFWSVDPLGGNPRNGQSWNRYAYVLGNPLKYIDPLGLAEIDACSGSSEGDIECSGSVDAGNNKDPYRPFDAGSFLYFLVSGPNRAGNRVDQVLANLSDAYQEQFEYHAVEGNYAAAFLDFLAPFLLPENSGELGVELAMAVVPPLRAGKVLRRTTKGIDPNKLHHIFGQPRHNLDDVVEAVGSREAAFHALQKGAQSAVNAGKLTGRFETVINVGGFEVTVRGAVVDGVARIGTAFR